MAEDLAARMDYDTGHVRYCEAEMVARTGVSRANLYRHMRYLRELGALAYVVHGSRANSRREKGLKGWAGTATVFAAVIPAVYDHAMGHTIVGSGYEARIVIDQRTAGNPVDNPPVDNPGSQALETPSLTMVKKKDQVQEVGGVTTTAERSRNDSAPNTSSSKKRATILGTTVTAAGMQLGDKLARAIRRRVSWVRKASHDQLRWVCADMGEQQWTEDQAVRFVVEAGFTHRAGFAWEPDRPHRLIAAELRAHQEQTEQDRQDQEAREQAVSWEDSTAGRAAAAARASLEKLFGTLEPEPKQAYTAEERERARLYGWDQWEEVAAHYAEDPDDAIVLYGVPLCQYAVAKAARLERQEAWA
ncbi:hypothetical protein [Streptomyces sp. NPDC093269]|uniref:hypothetical protein n=1 Tax=Streptomyces sp. NPDC093269 TaxID=3366038 RepID=UPI003815464E